MKGNTLEQFIDDLLTMGGPEKEFTYKNHRYFLETTQISETEMDMYVFEIFEDKECPYLCHCIGKDLAKCVAKFEKERIFEGKTIYEVEQDIVVEYG